VPLRSRSSRFSPSHSEASDWRVSPAGEAVVNVALLQREHPTTPAAPQQMSQVVAFTCQQCGVDFPAMGGGVCVACRRTLCASHYGRPDSDDAVESPELRCDDCRASAPAKPRAEARA